MANLVKFPSVHAMRAERRLGHSLPGILQATQDFYHPIPVMGCPGRVWSHRGDLIGTLRAGQFGNLAQRCAEIARRRFRRAARRRSLNMGFASFEDLINAGTYEGLMQTFPFQKSSITKTSAGRVCSLWFVGVVPPAASTTP